MSATERYPDREPPADEVAEFSRRRRWFHVQALALPSALVIALVAVGLADQRLAALAGGALVLAAIAALRCGRTLVAFCHDWLDVRDDDPWFDGRAVRGPELMSVLAMLALGLAIAIFGAAGRLDLIVAGWRH